jgi:hypothetical protein
MLAIIAATTTTAGRPSPSCSAYIDHCCLHILCPVNSKETGTQAQ